MDWAECRTVHESTSMALSSLKHVHVVIFSAETTGTSGTGNASSTRLLVHRQRYPSGFVRSGSEPSTSATPCGQTDTAAVCAPPLPREKRKLAPDPCRTRLAPVRRGEESCREQVHKSVEGRQGGAGGGGFRWTEHGKSLEILGHHARLLDSAAVAEKVHAEYPEAFKQAQRFQTIQQPEQGRSNGIQR